MFIDYVPLLLINMAAGLIMLAHYIVYCLDQRYQKKWAVGFLVVGLIALVYGSHMTLTWPLPGSYNVSFGETSVLLGALFLGASLAIIFDWGLTILSIYGFFAASVAVLIGARIINLKLTQEPIISGIGFILTGLSGILALPVIYFKGNKFLRIFVSIILIAAALIWLRTAYKAYWMHLSGLSNWVPETMQAR